MFKKLLFFILFFPTLSFATINFTEIMCDPDGTDTGREWVEIQNTNGVSVDLEKYKFCDGTLEKESCHSLRDSTGNKFKIPLRSYGIIARDPVKFKLDYPDFNGFILEATFSLSNTGEFLRLKDQNKTVISLAEYNTEVGGKKGDSISLMGDTWRNGKATPNAANILKEINQGDDDNNNSSSGKVVKSEIVKESQKIEKTFVKIEKNHDIFGRRREFRSEILDNVATLVAGAENEFNGVAYGLTGTEITGMDFFWNFGDGKKKWGQNVKHTFFYPGDYVVSLTFKSGRSTGNSKKIFKVISPNMEISEVDVKKNWIKIKNNHPEILKLDNWFLMVDGKKFKIPRETYVLANGTLIFPVEITYLFIKENSKIYLLFPNETKATRFVWESDKIIVKQSTLDKVDESGKVEKPVDKN